MAVFKNRRVAAAIAVLLMLLSLLLGARRSLGAQRRSALDAYASGDENGLSILAKLGSITEHTALLLQTAAGCYPASSQLLTQLQAVYEQLTADGTAQQRREQLSQLAVACTQLQMDYEARSDLPQEAVRAMEHSINDILSLRDQIRHSGYNQLAQNYNDLLAGFPAGLLARLTGFAPLPLF